MDQRNNSGNTLELLAQYNDHRFQKEKAIERIEGRTASEGSRPTYDDLFKENVKLKLQNKELESEVEALNKMIHALRTGRPIHSGTSLSQIIEKHDEENDKELTLPPRSADRNRNAKNLHLLFNSPPYSDAPHIDVTSESDEQSDRQELPRVEKTSLLPNSSGTGLVGSNPAPSATYTSSRITVSHPSSPRRPLVEHRIRSPQSANRAATVINNQLHSPMGSSLVGETSIDLTTSSEKLPSPPTEMEKEFGIIKKPFSKSADLVLHEKITEFSPASKQNLSNFSEYLDDTFKDESESIDTQIADDTTMERTSSDTAKNNVPQHAPPPIPFPQMIEAPNQHVASQLGSPIMLNRKDQNHMQNRDPHQAKSPLGMSFANSRSRDNVADQAVSKTLSTECLSIKSSTTANSTISHADAGSRVRRPHAASVSTVASSAPSILPDIPLFVQPDEFDTIRLEVSSTLFFETETSEQPHILFTVIDRNSNKDIFKFAKTVKKLYDLDAYLRQRLPSSTLLTLPDRQTFDVLVPTKVDNRREKLNNYFAALFKILELAPVLSLRVAQFMSTDTVMNPVMVGDTSKEGSLLMRRAKTLGNGSNWRVRYGVLHGEVLQLFDKGQLAEGINLKQSNIELLPNLPEDRYGTRNGFLVNEHRKSGLSSTTKYYLCAETSKERELWVTAISEFVTSLVPAPPLSSGSSAATTTAATMAAATTGTATTAAATTTVMEDAGSSSVTKSDSSVDQIYVTDLTEPTTVTSNAESINSSPRVVSDSGDDDKENRRLKMRSFFPFKKLASNAFSMVADDTETVASQESEPKYSDNSIAKSLESMHLTEPAVATVFGSPLDRCLQLSSHNYQGKYEIPSVVYRCLEYLYKNRGIHEEGIFRLSGSSALIKSLQERFDREYDIDLCKYNENVADGGPSSKTLGIYIDVNTISGLLKLYLRKLPHMIFGDELYPMFKQVAEENHENPAQVALEFRKLIKADIIPRPNVSLMYVLFELLVRIDENNRSNKMNLRNLCIVFSPTLNIPVTILQPFITDFTCIFQDGQPADQQKREKIDLHIPGV